MRQTTQQQVQQVGSDFIRRWYERIDAKAPFETIAGDTVGAELVVEAPHPQDGDGRGAGTSGDPRVDYLAGREQRPGGDCPVS